MTEQTPPPTSGSTGPAHAPDAGRAPENQSSSDFDPRAPRAPAAPPEGGSGSSGGQSGGGDGRRRRRRRSLARSEHGAAEGAAEARFVDEGDAPENFAAAGADPATGESDAGAAEGTGRRRGRRSRGRSRRVPPPDQAVAAPFHDGLEESFPGDEAAEPESPGAEGAARSGRGRGRRRAGAERAGSRGDDRAVRADERVAERPGAATRSGDATEEEFAAGDERGTGSEWRDETDSAQESEGGNGRRRKRSRRRGRRGRSGEGEPAHGTDGQPAAEVASPEEGEADSRRRGSRGGRRRRRGKGGRSPAPVAGAPSGGAVRLDLIPGEFDEQDEEWTRAQRSLPSAAEPQAARGERDRQGRRRRRRDEDEPEEELSARRRDAQVVRDQVILVNAVDPEETRVVVIEKGRIVDLQMTVDEHTSYVNDIYRGRVVNIESAIGAAFVDFGQGRNGFLHVSDVMEVYGEDDWSLDKLLAARTEVEEWESKGPKAEEFDGDEGPAGEDGGAEEGGAEEGGGRQARRGAKGREAGKDRARARRGRSRRRNIDELLEKGQLVVGQITKDAIGDKGPTLTTYISIPGRYLVLMPSLQRTGVSRKIEDDKERRRLKRILQGLQIPEGMGVIVRTAGIGKTKSEIKRDLDYLLAVWTTFSEKLVLGRSPAPLYQESDVAIRTMRDLFSSRTEKVVVDDPEVHARMIEFTRQLMPEHMDRVLLHDGQKPLFHEYNIESDFEKIFARRVELPSGGSIVLDQTEALVAIDVNSGRTRDDGADFEDIALKTNLEAVTEIARQIRLRDLGGIIVCDFIDMLRMQSRRQVEKALHDRLAEDRARSKLGRVSQFGLLELTRQRLGPGLSKLLYDSCPTCRGSGRRRTAQSRAQALLRRLGAALLQKGFTKIEVLAHPDTIEWLRRKDKAQLQALEEKFKREIVFKGVEEQSEDSIFHYLRADGREVRPGGRRKR